ncbi:MAG TPA: PP2C family protein-serine/threonine phosphatase, partial [Candidatus Ozemobacteraceae bacterium]|nr:PP2C family protein-serine/threonine phosphatase [Candidatus Ozemobacteraceae bacterium]
NDHASAFMIGDVSGHGVSASLVMAMAKARVFSHFDEGGTESGLLEQLNDLLFHLTSRRQLMTFCLVLVDFSTHTGTITAAGNPLPVFLRRSDTSVRHLGAIAYPLAVREQQRFEPTPFTFAPGDLLLLYTDGVVEAIDSEQRPYGYDRLQRLMQQTADLGVHGLVQYLQADLGHHLGSCLPLDDITVLALGRVADNHPCTSQTIIIDSPDKESHQA